MCFNRLKKISAATRSEGSSEQHCPISQASQVQLDSLPMSGSSQPKCVNDSKPVEIDDDGTKIEEEAIVSRSKRRRTSKVWQFFSIVKDGHIEYAVCATCCTKLRVASSSGTSHLRRHRCYKDYCALAAKITPEHAITAEASLSDPMEPFYDIYG